MSQKLSVLLVWNGTDFEPADQRGFRDERQTVVFIDENNQQIVARISPHEPSLEQRIIQRRLHSLAKAGYQYSSKLRINTSNFSMKEIDGDFKISDYQGGKSMGESRTTTSPRPRLEPPINLSESVSPSIQSMGQQMQEHTESHSNPSSMVDNDYLLSMAGKIDEFLNKGMRVFVEPSKKIGCKYRISCLGSNEVVEL